MNVLYSDLLIFFPVNLPNKKIFKAYLLMIEPKQISFMCINVTFSSSFGPFPINTTTCLQPLTFEGIISRIYISNNFLYIFISQEEGPLMV
jgi:hypothetical protein